MKRSLILLAVVALVAAYVYYFEVRKESRIQSTDEREQASRTLTGAGKDDIVGFALAKSGSQPTALELVNGEWVMTSPVKSATEESAVKAILWDLEWTEKQGDAIEPEDLTPEKLKSFGLDAPEGSIEVTLKTKALNFIIGGKNLSGTSVYVRAGSDGPAYLVASKFADNLDKTVFELRNKTIMPLLTPQVAYIKLVGPTTASITKVDDQWNIAEPFADYADAESVNALVKEANGLLVQEFASEDTASFAEFGLEKPDKYVSFAEATGGGRSYVINFGGDAGTDAGGERLVYAALAGGKTAYKVKAAIVDKLFPTLAALQYKKVARFDQYALKTLTITSGMNEVQLARPDYDWKVTKPYEADADNRVVGEVLAHMGDALIAQIVTSEPEKEKYGIETPRASFSFVQARREPVGVIFGADAGDGMVYFKRTDTPAVYKTSARLLDKLATPAIKYHTLDVQKVTITSVDTFALTRHDGAYTVKRQSEGRMDNWQMIEPAKAPANVGMMMALEGALATLRAEELVEMNPQDPVRYGLDKPFIKIDFQMQASSARPKAVLIGTVSDTGKRYAMLEGGDLVFTVTSDLVRTLQDEVRDTRVFSYKTSDANRVEFIVGDVKTVLVKGEKDWKAETPADAVVSQSAVWNELSRLSQLVTPKFASYRATELDKYGLDKPRAVVRVIMPMGVAALSVGSVADTGHYYCTSTTVEGVFLLTPGDVERVLEPAKLLETPAPAVAPEAPHAPEIPQQSGEGAAQ